MKTDTPRTEAHPSRWQHGDSAEFIHADFARELERERDEARAILDNLEEIWHVMRPRYCGTPSMDGRYPCWIVWLPNEGKCERKELKDAILEFREQSKPKPEHQEPEND